MQEAWKDIVGYEGLYKVSNLGNVKSLYDGSHKIHREKMLYIGKDGCGYSQVTLYKKGVRKTYKVHRLVAEAFIVNIDNLPEINHKDENKNNNCIENLEWCDRKYNCNYGTKNKRISESHKGEKSYLYGRFGNDHPKSKKVICLETQEVFNSTSDIQRQLGINNGSISLCCRAKQKQAGNLTFRYLDQVLFYN